MKLGKPSWNFWKPRLSTTEINLLPEKEISFDTLLDQAENYNTKLYVIPKSEGKS